MPEKQAPTGDPTGYPFPQNPPVNAAVPMQPQAPKGDDGPLPEQEDETK